MLMIDYLLLRVSFPLAPYQFPHVMAVVSITWYTEQKLGAVPVPGGTTSRLNGKFRDHFEHQRRRGY